MKPWANDNAPAALAPRWIEGFNARDEQTLRDLYHRDAIVKRPTWPRRGSLASIQLDFGACPTESSNSARLSCENGWLWSSSVRVANTEQLTLFSGQEIPPTGRPLRLSGAILFDVDELGHITAERRYWEVYALVEFWMAVGLIPTEES